MWRYGRLHDALVQGFRSHQESYRLEGLVVAIGVLPQAYAVRRNGRIVFAIIYVTTECRPKENLAALFT